MAVLVVMLLWIVIILVGPRVDPVQMSPTPTPKVLKVVQELSDLSEFLGDDTEAVIVIEWRISCQYCQQEMLYLETISTEAIQVIGLNPYNDLAKQKMYAEEHGLSFPILYGAIPRSTAAVPFTLIYSVDGTLCGQFVGWDKENGPAQLATILECVL